MVENLLCESLRTKQGYDTFHPSQYIFFLDEPTDNILCVGSIGVITEVRSEDNDRQALDHLPSIDCVVPYYQWWKAKMGREGIHEWYVNLCCEKGVDPKSIVVRPHINAKSKNMTNGDVWEKYIRELNKSNETNCEKMWVDDRSANKLMDQIAKRKDSA
jgi:hypothetical protein